MGNQAAVLPQNALARIIGSKPFEYGITALILFNAVLLGLETFPSIVGTHGPQIAILNGIILNIFIIEILLRMLAFGRRFWSSGWNWFDLTVVTIAILPATGGFTALRALRAVRLLRLIAVVPSLRRVVEGLIQALPGLGSIIILLVLVLYVFAVMATTLFGPTNPELFGSLGSSAFSLFTVMTLEGWPDLARAVMEHHTWAWAFFIVFILASSFSVLNLFIGIIVDAMQSADKSEPGYVDAAEILAEVRSLRAEVQALRAALGEAPSGPA